MQKLVGVVAHLSEAFCRSVLSVFIFEALCYELHEFLSLLNWVLPFLIRLF